MPAPAPFGKPSAMGPGRGLRPGRDRSERINLPSTPPFYATRAAGTTILRGRVCVSSAGMTANRPDYRAQHKPPIRIPRTVDKLAGPARAEAARRPPTIRATSGSKRHGSGRSPRRPNPSHERKRVTPIRSASGSGRNSEPRSVSERRPSPSRQIHGIGAPSVSVRRSSGGRSSHGTGARREWRAAAVEEKCRQALGQPP